MDYGLGNLFSIKHACKRVGMQPIITSTREEILNADAVILPGVGAFGDAMSSLKKLDLIEPLEEVVASYKPLIGICLGMQLLLSQSYEFGIHEGLGFVDGSVFKIENHYKHNKLKVPHVGWNRIFRNNFHNDDLSNLLFKGINDGEFMYFVHSFYVIPKDLEIILTTSHYGDIEFCSSLRYRNIFAFQFHPERSGLAGLEIYKNLALITQRLKYKLAE